MHPLFRLFIFCSVFLTLLSTPLISGAEQASKEAHGWRPAIKAQVRSHAIALSEMDDGGGEVGVWENRVSLKASPVSLSYEVRSYQWEDKHKLPLVDNGETPFENLHRLSIGLSHQGVIADQWGWFAGLTGVSAFESELDDSFGGAFRAGISYSFDKRWQVMAGGTIFVNAIRVRAFPILGVVYNGIGEDGTGLLASLTAPDASVTYKFTPWFGMSGNFNLDTRFYRLADDSDIESEGYLSTRAFQTSLLAEFTPVSGLNVNFGPTFNFAREMTVYRKNGDKVRSPNIDSTLGVACDVSYKF